MKSRINSQPKSYGGKEHGLREQYHDNAQLEFKENFKDGELDGLIENYYEDGELRVGFCYKDGERVDMSYCEK